ncbi:unnamed protein product [Linum tenue]|uniref:AT3G52170-like helix-turn-helix domain-containing protein n=1 Tax=Linum tenue TaxID=586396 RepID=A0AAV0M8G4_9ROSI|nr:unnamed protein product [Linum tenue]
MHAIKGSWVGQTFALFKSNESGGRKSSIRRSKEESKGMVELFIIKYQSLNNGNFPSLNLTHKEVGGSFYTVREIVREIIQENRVFGPAKFLPAEQDFHEWSEQYPGAQYPQNIILLQLWHPMELQYNLINVLVPVNMKNFLSVLIGLLMTMLKLDKSLMPVL